MLMKLFVISKNGKGNAYSEFRFLQEYGVRDIHFRNSVYIPVEINAVIIFNYLKESCRKKGKFRAGRPTGFFRKSGFVKEIFSF